jgi:hypothetical protein
LKNGTTRPSNEDSECTPQFWGFPKVADPKNHPIFNYSNYFSIGFKVMYQHVYVSHPQYDIAINGVVKICKPLRALWHRNLPHFFQH